MRIEREHSESEEYEAWNSDEKYCYELLIFRGKFKSFKIFENIRV